MENKENICNNWKKIKRYIHRERKPDKDEKTREFKKKKTAKKNEGVKERKTILKGLQLNPGPPASLATTLTTRQWLLGLL